MLRRPFNKDIIFQTQYNGIQSFKGDFSDWEYKIYFYWGHLIPLVEKEALAYNLGNTSTYENATNYVFDVTLNGNTVLQKSDIPNHIGSESAIKALKLTSKNAKKYR